MKGQIIKLAHLTVVPYEYTSGNAMFCCVVESKHPSYPVGGYNIVVPLDELKLGTEMVASKKEKR